MTTLLAGITPIWSSVERYQALQLADFARNMMAVGKWQGCEESGGLVSSKVQFRLTPSLSSLNSPICDSYVRPATLVHICEECNFGSAAHKCLVCGNLGIAVSWWLQRWPKVYWSTNYFALCGSDVQDAYYCAECTRLEKDRDGCPKVVNLGASRTDLFYLRKKNKDQGWAAILNFWFRSALQTVSHSFNLQLSTGVD